MHVTTSRLFGSFLLLAATMAGCAGSAPDTQEAPVEQQEAPLAGSRTWGAQAGGFDGLGGVAVHRSGQVTVAGSSSSDVVVSRFNPNGELLWSKRFGDSQYQQGTQVAVDGAGNVILVGDYWGELDFGGGALSCKGSPGSPRAFVAKLGPAGDHLWSRCFGDGGQQQAGGLAVGPGGDVYVSGYFAGEIDFGNGPVTSGSSSSQFVARLTPEGTAVWSTRYEAGLVTLTTLAVDGAGNAFVGGSYVDMLTVGGGTLLNEPGFNVYLLKLDASGAASWAKGFGPASSQTQWRIAADGQGNLVAAGSFVGTVDFGGGPLTSGDGDVFVLSLDASGSHRWSRRFGGGGFDWANDVAVDGAGNALVTGSFPQSIDFGTGALASAGGEDVFVAKLDTAGQALWSRGFGDYANQSAHRVAAAGAQDAVLWGSLSGSIDFGTGPLSGWSPDTFVARVGAP